MASNEERGNHLGDSYLYSGLFDGVVYHGALQFDLSAVPRGATIHAGTLEMAGLDAKRLGGSGVWEVRVLEREADEGLIGDIEIGWLATTLKITGRKLFVSNAWIGDALSRRSVFMRLRPGAFGAIAGGAMYTKIEPPSYSSLNSTSQSRRL